MATLFPAYVMVGGSVGTNCDFTTLASAEDQLECDLTSTATRVYNGTLTGTLANNAVVTLYDGVAAVDPLNTATVIRCGYQGTALMLINVTSVDHVSVGNHWRSAAGNMFAVASPATGDTVIANIRCACSGGSADTTVVIFDSASWTTNATNYILVDAASGHSAAQTWDTGKYRLDTGSGTPCITLQEEFLTIRGLQIKPSNRHGIFAYYSVATCIQAIENCHIVWSGTVTYAANGINIGSATAAARTLYINNCIIRNFPQSANSASGYAIFLSSGNGSNVFVSNNTIIDCEKGIRINSVGGGSPTVSVVNNIFDGITSKASIFLGTMILNRNNCSDVDTANYSQLAVGTVADSGTTDGAAPNKLIDAGQNFTTTVKVGMIVANTTTPGYTKVTAVDNDGQLSVEHDIFATAENYTIYTNIAGAVLFQDRAGINYAVSAADTVALNLGFDYSAIGHTTDINGTERPQMSVWDIGAYELAGVAGITGGGFSRFFAFTQSSMNTSCPSDLYTGDTVAQDGTTNPTNIIDLSPMFSAIPHPFPGTTVSAFRLQVSGVDDPTFTATATSWDTDWTNFASVITGANRCADIEYGV